MSPFDPKIHHRRSIRLPGYDYSQAGAYFVTIVAWQRECLFGDVVDGEPPEGDRMKLNRMGQIAQQAWFDLPKHYPHVDLGAFCIMPNHVHAIIVLLDDIGRGGSRIAGRVHLPDVNLAGDDTLQAVQTHPYVAGGTNLPANNVAGATGKAKRHPLSEIVRAFKSFSAKRINFLRKTPGIPVWQRNYYEHIIRDEREMERIWGYIDANPAKWADDEENPSKI